MTQWVGVMSGENIQPSINDRLRHLALCFFCWVYAFCFGLVVLDVVYARQLEAEFDTALISGIFP